MQTHTHKVGRLQNGQLGGPVQIVKQHVSHCPHFQEKLPYIIPWITPFKEFGLQLILRIVIIIGILILLTIPIIIVITVILVIIVDIRILIGTIIILVIIISCRGNFGKLLECSEFDLSPGHGHRASRGAPWSLNQQRPRKSRRFQ